MFHKIERRNPIGHETLLIVDGALLRPEELLELWPEVGWRPEEIAEVVRLLEVGMPDLFPRPASVAA